jgi:Holliday junction resolvase RusA-like endonuclease
MEYLSGKIYTNPVTKDRPRLTKGGHSYNTDKTRLAQQKQSLLFRGMAMRSGNKFPIPRNVPLEVSLVFSHKDKKRVGPKLTTPDVDNLCKLTLDAITNSRIWNDDKQVTKLILEDLWVGPDTNSSIQFDIRKHVPTGESILEQKHDNLIFKGMIPLTPKAKARPKLSSNKVAYNPETTRVAQAEQAVFFVSQQKESAESLPLSKVQPVEVHINFYHKGDGNERPKLSVPDLDNLLKLTLDAMTDAGIWTTDSQITKIVAEDLLATKGENARIEYVIKKHVV